MNIAEFYPRKSLGQNFLIDDNIKVKIIQACNVSSEEFVLEIGPGKGALTQELVKLAKGVVAVEKDVRLFQMLCQTLGGYLNLSLVNQDILTYRISQSNTKVIGNIPYNISSPLIEHLLMQKDKISVIYLTLQKELAERIIAKPRTKAYSSFSIFVQYHSVPTIKFIIKRGSFRPRPKVDSAFVEFVIRKTPAVTVKDEEFFFKIVRAAFGQRRKMISNTLKGLVDQEKICQTGISPSIRPEDLSLDDFGRLANSS
ncbi:MAG: 16S rRNA (adenine(1518)-N(6)/adenine(1519)-N(6))-dimethyltransferase RsmA [Candidatus Omnitrophica bacterium]|nr:16S rRNA (adenine(1518)-N(6)/adenine(1519)-N(6))-dimethyltransferase RsmA [Candidatus Omnitrophota bacterium]